MVLSMADDGPVEKRSGLTLTDQDLIVHAERLAEEEKLLEAARLLEKVKDHKLLSTHLKNVRFLAKDCKEAIADLLDSNPEDDGWIYHGENHGKSFDTELFYKVDDHARLTCRMETPIEPSMLVPLLATLNEVELFPEWIPSWRIPRMGVSSSKLLQQIGRANKIVQVTADMPFPYCKREAVLQATAIDEIDHGKYVAVRIHTLDVGGVVPPPEPGVERIDFQGTFLFRASQAHPGKILVSFKMFVDSHIKGVPLSLINFVTKTVIGHMWDMLLQVAQGVRDGVRPKHQKEIAAKSELYAWVEDRIGTMLQNVKVADEPMVEAVVEDYQFVAYLQS